ncbi:hypothetical protein LEAN103870_09000 [Legionella anisa]|uniref:Type IV secretion protein Dot n=1 Tax=Legionella anisa TaxID=28082 RepID=A0AAX0WXW2_9GAMM|nr:hypothetical protein [Legionella anisa]AWN72851.1 hypothetical protein DLD14_02785 [Legionella anisa]KTC70701.1 hypothetical protein Lani_2248 [Legionella anisa]MCW8423655.1 hypothetical protein [Legionella anisa]MCW8447175.1 hypothetical protein [Legionella anisa]PNL63306.1 hypothetical protein A6J39_020070 [Legionella anisa]
MRAILKTASTLRTKLGANLRMTKAIPQTIQKLFPFSPLQHPLAPVVQNSLTNSQLRAMHIEEDELKLIQKLHDSNKFYILEDHNKILKQFFSAKQKEDSPLGNLYKEMDYPGFLSRLVTKKFKAVYADGRLVMPREHTAEFAKAYQQRKEKYKSSRKLLEVIGTAEDDLLYKEYLSLEEGAVSPLIVPQAYFLPLSDGSRTEFSPVLYGLNLQRGSLFDEWKNAHPYPVSISYLAAPEFRNCLSLQYDVLACVRFENSVGEAAHFAARQTLAVKQPGFASVLSSIYGEDNALSDLNTTQSNTITFNSPVFGKGIFYVDAYKNRLKHNLHQLLLLADLSLSEEGALTIKGMSLGAFAIQEILYPMERTFYAALEEILAELDLPKIKKINLINFPSALDKFSDPRDREYALLIGHIIKTKTINVHGRTIEVNTSVGAPLAAQPEKNLATHICGDSLSFPGNEAHAGIPPKVSSDDSVMHYAGGCFSMTKDIQSSSLDIQNKMHVISGNRATLFNQYESRNEKETPELRSQFRSTC